MKMLIGFSVATALTFSGAALLAHEYKSGSLEIVRPWARATPISAKTGAGYVTINNRGAEPDRLLGVECACSASAMLHETKVENDVAKMRHVEAVDLPPDGTVRLAPGGLHVMFMGLKAPFKEEDRLEAMLIFEKAGRVPVEFQVQAIGATEPARDH